MRVSRARADCRARQAEPADIRETAGTASARLKLAGLAADAGVLALSFDVALPLDYTRSVTFAAAGLPEGYVCTIYRNDKGLYRVGIINPLGIRTDDIALDFEAASGTALNEIDVNNIVLNDASSPDVVFSDVMTNVPAPAAAPDRFALVGAYPNPFNPSTLIIVDVPETAALTLEVFNAAGMKIRTLLAGEMRPGRHELVWDGLNDAGRSVASGQYFCRMQAGTYARSIKLLMLK